MRHCLLLFPVQNAKLTGQIGQVIIVTTSIAGMDDATNYLRTTEPD